MRLDMKFISSYNWESIVGEHYSRLDDWDADTGWLRAPCNHAKTNVRAGGMPFGRAGPEALRASPTAGGG
jgi:hypothetical protein